MFSWIAHFVRRHTRYDGVPRDVLLKYTVSGICGRGGNACVYRGIRKSDGATYAIKVLRTPRGSSLKRFCREIDVVSEWAEKTDRILPIIDVGKGKKWYSMPWAVSCDHGREKFTATDWVKFVVQEFVGLSRLLERLHSAKIYHRDIKPANILLHNGHFVLSDFGLVRDMSVKSDLTMSQKKLGPVFTMAPEMRRNPADSDGAAADVYSLGKTLWMLLMGDEKGFEGQYSWDDGTMRLHRDVRYSDLSLAMVEGLLHQATDNDPAKRPTAAEFAKRLEVYLKIIDVGSLAQRSEWDFLAKSLFNGNPPRHAEYDDPLTIVSILNQLAVRPTYNHMLYPDGGGLDLQSVDLAPEAGCIAIRTDGSVDILKPKCLHIEVFPKGENSYFLLEADELQQLDGVDDDGLISQRVVEDLPGHYVSARAAQYGVYDYDTGVKLPASARVVRRYLNGKFLVVPKSGPYNHIAGVYDARHNDASVEQLRMYMELVAASNDIQLKTGLIGGKNIFDNEIFKRNIFADRKKEVPAIRFADDKLRNEIETIDFKRFLVGGRIADNDARLKFWVTIDGLELGSSIDDALSDRSCVLRNNGRFCRKALPDSETYYLYSRSDTELLCLKIEEFLRVNYESDGSKLSGNINVFGEWICVNKPEHVFSRDELESVLRGADDRHHNRLVVDENGYVRSVGLGDGRVIYPVRNETYCAGNNYVGRYADYSDERLDELYGSMLKGFWDYLRTGRSQYVEYSYGGDVAQLLEDVKSELMNEN